MACSAASGALARAARGARVETGAGAGRGRRIESRLLIGGSRGASPTPRMNPFKFQMLGPMRSWIVIFPDGRPPEPHARDLAQPPRPREDVGSCSFARRAA